MEKLEVYVDSECKAKVNQSAMKPKGADYAIVGESANFELYVRNEGEKSVENIVLREKNFKVESMPFSLGPHEKCLITVKFEFPNDLEYSPKLNFQFFKLLPPIPWERFENAAQVEYPDRNYKIEEAKTVIPSVFRLYRKAEARIPFKVKLGKKTFENKTKHDLTSFDFPQPRKTSETGGAMVFRLENRDFAVVQAYVAPSKSDDSRQILFWLIPCTVEQIAKNKRVAKVKFDEGGSVDLWAWPFTKDKANDFQLLMDFLTQKYADKWLLYVKFDGKGGYDFENWMLVQ
jgi:hypothetical protein